jgi:hypothetical protein
MGVTNSTPINLAITDANILQSIKSKKHSVVSFNDNPQVFNKSGNIMVNELKETDEKGNMCQKLPEQSVLKYDPADTYKVIRPRPSNSINKNIFISSDNKYVRLFADKKCRIRANEESYGTVSKPESDLFNPNLSEQAKLGSTTNFTYVPYNNYQNAHYYKITDIPFNTPRLPQFYIKNKSTGVYLNKQFVEYDDNRGTVCRKIPTTNPTDYNLKLDYNFQPLATDFNREVGVDRFPDELNTNANATNPDGTPIKYIPISIYTDVVRDINDNVFDKKGYLIEKDEKNEPIINDDDTDVTCGNIHTNDKITNPISGGYRLKDNFPNDSIPDAKPNQMNRYTPIPYTKVSNYGTVVADRSNSLYYELKGEKGLLD